MQSGVSSRRTDMVLWVWNGGFWMAWAKWVLGEQRERKQSFRILWKPDRYFGFTWWYLFPLCQGTVCSLAIILHVVLERLNSSMTWLALCTIWTTRCSRTQGPWPSLWHNIHKHWEREGVYFTFKFLVTGILRAWSCWEQFSSAAWKKLLIKQNLTRKAEAKGRKGNTFKAPLHHKGPEFSHCLQGEHPQLWEPQ